MGKPAQSEYGRFIILGALLAAGLAAVVWLNWGQRQPEPPPSKPEFPLPPYSTTKYLNTGPEAQYIGVAACAACHQKNHASYLLTPHSRALSDLDPKAEPPDGAFFHQPSGRTYRVYRKGDQLRQQEALHTAEGAEIARVDLPVRYLIGSGHFTRSYLVEVDGFLHESPISWYASKKSWDMSPGYDFAKHWSFERPIKLGCLACHAGRVEPAQDTVRLKIHEKAIGCESCHGPGSLHAERYRPGTPKQSGPDLTIVNPTKLPRELLESVCAACHLSAAATVTLRGRGHHDFRPGRPLTDYRVDYRLDIGNEQMTVVGHIDQLRQSACYQKSKGLTCLTCHDPHEPEKPTNPAAFFRQKCLKCHTEQACGVTVEQRVKKAGADNCMTCRMPTGDTDIPHIAFTHHRIGRHGTKSSEVPGRVPTLVPTGDVTHLSELDRQRNLGIAYLMLVDNPKYAQHADAFHARARELLEPAYSAGIRDGVTAQALATAFWRSNPVRAGGYAQQALEAKNMAAEIRAPALVIRADGYLKEGKPFEAIKLLEELVGIRRYSEDWRLLGRLYLEHYQPDRARRALEQAAAIRPFRYDIHGALAEAYRQVGDTESAREHLAKAQWLRDHKQE